MPVVPEGRPLSKKPDWMLMQLVSASCGVRRLALPDSGLPYTSRHVLSDSFLASPRASVAVSEEWTTQVTGSTLKADQASYNMTFGAAPTYM